MSKQVKHAERAHALLSASGASRWLNCTPSPRLEEHRPDSTSAYAEEGTLAHEFVEMELRGVLGSSTTAEYESKRSELSRHALYDPEMEGHALRHVDYVLEARGVALKDTGDCTVLVEQRVDFSDLVPGGFGTGDTVILSDRILEVIDYKYGKGVPVSAVDNDQLKLYAYGAMRGHELSYDIKTIRLTIVQPRLDTISSWDMSVEALLTWAEEVVRPKAVMADKGEGELSPGPWCRFCKVKPRCRAHAALMDEMAAREFAEPALLEDDELLAIRAKAGLVMDWLKSVEEHIYSEALGGKKWRGLKLVEGRSSRTITDSKAAADALRGSGFSEEEIFTQKIQGITAMEKLLGRDLFQDLIGPYVVKPPGRPTLTTEDDPRPEYSTALADFS